MALSEKAQELIDQKFMEAWAANTLDDIRENFRRRKVFPYGLPGPYAQFGKLNKEREQKKKWHSTGMGIQEMYARVWVSAGGDQARIVYFFNRYLNLMEFGVGRGRKYEDVKERAATARYDQTLAHWGIPSDAKGGHHVKGQQSRRMRPTLLMEFRHQLTKMQYIISAKVGELVEDAGFEDMTDDLRYSSGPGIYVRQ